MSSTALVERPTLVEDGWHRCESPLRVLESAAPRFRLLEGRVSVADDGDEPAVRRATPSLDDIEVL